MSTQDWNNSYKCHIWSFRHSPEALATEHAVRRIPATQLSQQRSTVSTILAETSPCNLSLTILYIPNAAFPNSNVLLSTETHTRTDASPNHKSASSLKHSFSSEWFLIQHLEILRMAKISPLRILHHPHYITLSPTERNMTLESCVKHLCNIS